MECQICFSTEYNDKFTCNKCKKNICFECLETYINITTDFLKCSCTEYILPSYLEKVKNIDKYKLFMIKRIEMNFFEDISSTKDFLGNVNQIRKKRQEIILKFPVCVKQTIESCFKKEFQSVQQKIQRRKINLTKICHRSNCDGDISENICIKCTVKYCDFCMEIENEQHSCDGNDILSKNYIKNMSIFCPNCSLPIEKSSGCSYLTCAVCYTNFDHSTMNLSTHGGYSEKINVNTSSKTSTKLIEKYTDLPEQTLDKIFYIENYRLKYSKLMIKNLVLDNKDRCIKYYEKYLKEQKIYKEYLKILEKIDVSSNKESVIKIVESVKIY